MSVFQIREYSFTYPSETEAALKEITFSIEEGRFYVLCGRSGSGKSTLLRQLKTVLTPKGKIQGDIYYGKRKLAEVSAKEQSAQIGFVFQNPDNQIVTDKVWHEMAFGLESLGYDSEQIHLRVAEMASYFGITDWFYEEVSALSGGQKQLLNLASVMAMHPRVLLLDEPTSQLDPVAALDFLNVLYRLTVDFGVTVFLSEHHLEDVISLADTVLVMEQGRMVAASSLRQLGEKCRELPEAVFQAMPTAMRIYAEMGGKGDCPYTVAMGRRWLSEEIHASKTALDKGDPFLKQGKEKLNNKGLVHPSVLENSTKQKVIMQLRNVSFRYERNSPEIIHALSLSIREGEIFALLGGNGTGKTTALNLMAGLLRPQQGEIELRGKKLQKYAAGELYHGILSMLPQDATGLFVKTTVKEELREGILTEEQEKEYQEILELLQLSSLLEKHPFDLSGGEQQKVALAKILLLQAKIVLLDEPTKSFDAKLKQDFGILLRKLQQKGITVVLVSHDLEFCAEYTDRAGLFFDGSLAAVKNTREFFAGNHFYTTAANRMARQFFPEAVTVAEVVECLREKKKAPSSAACEKEPEKQALFKEQNPGATANQTGQMQPEKPLPGKKSKNLSKAYFLLAVFILVPLTIWVGATLLEDRKYLFVSLLIALYAVLPFFGIFQRRKLKVQKLVIIAVLTALAVVGRLAFFMLPSIKPMAAVAILAGVSLGAESGFLTGALSMLVSNLLFGQGPWTPWQMFSMGLIGLVAGVLAQLGILKGKRRRMCLYGFFAVLLFYGGIMNPASLVMAAYEITPQSLFAIYMSGLPLDLIHAFSTVAFLVLAGKTVLEKLDRIKLRYDIEDD